MTSCHPDGREAAGGSAFVLTRRDPHRAAHVRGIHAGTRARDAGRTGSAACISRRRAPPVAPQFDRAVALLHSFEFGAAIRRSTTCSPTDSTCAMAQWGIALSRWGNPMAAGNRAPAQLAQGREAAAAARGSRSRRIGARARDTSARWASSTRTTSTSTSARASWRTSARWPSSWPKQPADTEAKIFHAIALVAVGAADRQDVRESARSGRHARVAVGEAAEPPGARALHHPQRTTFRRSPPRARAAAQRYATIAPSAAHALHMPSHTFTRVGHVAAVGRARTRARCSVRRAAASIAEALHAADYAMYADLQLGRWLARRKAILDGLPALAARFDPNAVTGAAPGSAGVFALAAIPAR